MYMYLIQKQMNLYTEICFCKMLYLVKVQTALTFEH